MRGDSHEFTRFCIVGGIAFLADTVLLLTLTSLAVLPDAGARILSIAVGMHVAYILNACYTYRGHQGIGLGTWRRFVLSNTLGALINYVVFLGMLSLLPAAYPAADRLFSAACGTGVALLFNYWANKRFAFRKPGE